ncbi:hypothetical protein M2282_001267 [Variovorax boronicumulans]|uniref:hypothetical protein n=1 Tax=Variovorax boronicumulans TaxID=436515 RepID=UPI00247607F9|nr:hypothetical protein [Variovorax boronicumulans]MDH6166126.1 hypothetical protein [Variovorax boronicumulans]
MSSARSPLSSRPGWRIAASIYTVAGAVCVLGSAVVPESDVGMLVAIAGGLPWSLGLLTLDLSPGVASTALLLLAGSWTVNAALLWWLALRPRDPAALHDAQLPSRAAKRTR